ncbi:MAG: hypothetical protein Q4B65_01200, partial [Candidatus Saccharibacteria bacterium]|nr:hypothetical protein [Candidatus Saccharibacteria bacterium]
MKSIEPNENNTYGKLLELASPEAREFFEKWHRPFVNVKTLKINSRSINYYETIGLIKNLRGKKNGWRKFTYVEAVYLMILCEMRKYGIDTKFIKTFYNNFVRDNDEAFTEAILLT